MTLSYVHSFALTETEFERLPPDVFLRMLGNRVLIQMAYYMGNNDAFAQRQEYRLWIEANATGFYFIDTPPSDGTCELCRIYFEQECDMVHFKLRFAGAPEGGR